MAPQYLWVLYRKHAFLQIKWTFVEHKISISKIVDDKMFN